MMLIERLGALGSPDVEPPDNNVMNHYFPIRNKKNEFDYDTVAGKILGLIMGKELNNEDFNFEAYKATCLDELGALLSDEQPMLDHLEQMYFQNDAINKASPEFLLLGQKNKLTAASGHLYDIFQSFLKQYPQHSELQSKANFIEKIFLDVLQQYLEKPGAKKKNKQKEAKLIPEPYLPFLAEQFAHDIRFLTSKTEYLLTQFNNFLELYNFLYCAQLALNIRNWPHGEPKSQRMFFILDTEKANQERTDVKSYGFHALFNAVGVVFPILSMLENLNKISKGPVVPLWQYGSALNALEKNGTDTTELANAIASYAEKFREKRKIKPREANDNSPTSQLRLLTRYATDQFDTNRYDESSTRHEIRDKYQKEFETHIACHFMQTRGRSGRTLVMNQDYLMLLTNLAIGADRQLRFQELLSEFRHRGVYFDKQSEQALIAFYERVGNVDRMSDSGDAVYVRSTI